MALLFLYRDNNHHGEYNQNWSHDGLHHDTKHLLLGDSPSHSKLSFHLFDSHLVKRVPQGSRLSLRTHSP